MTEPDRFARQPDGAPADDIGPPTAPGSARQRALLAAAFRLILRSGTAVAPSQLATALGPATGSVTEDLAVLATAGRIRLDPQGDLLGSLGLTVVPTNHHIRVGRAMRYTWCALDALGILGALGSDGRIDSANPATGATFGIDFVAGTPVGYDQSWVLFVAARREVASVIDQWCPLVNFFQDAAAAAAWAAGHGVAGRCLTIAAATRFGSELWRQALSGFPGEARSSF